MKLDPKEINALLKRLEEDGATGLDLSPGNPDAKLAAKIIRQYMIDLGIADYTLTDIEERVEHSGTFEQLIDSINKICSGYWRWRNHE